MAARYCALVCTVILSACTANSHTNVPLADGSATSARATFNVDPAARGRQDTLFILAFSGGGSRAAR